MLNSPENTDAQDEENRILKTPGAVNSLQLAPAPLKKPFQQIAMALSGGGFRAASYSLGAMSYLNHLQYNNGTLNQSLLDNVTFISSASGGTFAGILYSMHVKQGLPFAETYKALVTFMKGEDLLERVLKLVNDDAAWTEGKSRNLINAFARIYNSDLFGTQTFGVYWPEANALPGRHLEVCFNTTEFYRGLSFRFQGGNDVGATGKTGNEFLYFDTRNATHVQTLKQIRLGDIMAASSCFPGGFEPMLFPKDFAYKSSGKPLETQALHDALVVTDYNTQRIDYKNNIGFMDGGIDDNEGIYSTMVADARRRRYDADNGFGLIFVTDVSGYFIDPYLPPVDSTGTDAKKTLCNVAEGYQKSISLFRRMVNGVVAGSLLLLVLIFGLYYLVPLFQYHDVFLVVCGILATLLVVSIAVKVLVTDQPLVKKLQHYLGLSDSETVSLLKKDIRSLKGFSNTSLTLLIRYLKNSPLGVLEQMLKARLNSLLSIVMDIDMNQIRRLTFDIFYGNFYGSATWDNRRVFNVIYELSTKNIDSRMEILIKKFNAKKYQLPPKEYPNDTWAKDCIAQLSEGCEKLQPIAEYARTMGTTLWFDKEDADTNRMLAVIACGQFTTCAKLLEYSMIIERLLYIQNLVPGTPKTIDFDGQQLQIFNTIKAQLIADWTAFKAHPYFLKEAMDGYLN